MRNLSVQRCVHGRYNLGTIFPAVAASDVGYNSGQRRVDPQVSFDRDGITLLARQSTKKKDGLSGRLRQIGTATTTAIMNHQTRQFASSGIVSSSDSTSDYPDGDEGRSKSWNDRAVDFLKRTEPSSSSTTSIGQSLNQDEAEVAKTIQDLLDGLLQITAVSIVDKNSMHDESVESERWETRDRALSPGSRGAVQSSVLEEEEEPVQVLLAFALMDRLVELEQAQNDALTNHTLQWSGHLRCLNPLLQLWKHEYASFAAASSPSNAMKSTTKTNAKVPTFTPSEILTKLDFYRQTSSLLIPDVQSYNILLDAVASVEQPNVDIAFCRNLWRWMWEESKTDSLLRPDLVTLRTLFKAYVATGHPNAPRQCEALVAEWTKRHPTNTDRTNSAAKSTGNDGQRNYDPRGSIMQSLIHVWALHNPNVAERYLKELVRRYREGETSHPPDTVAWNRVISAYAIAHGQPSKAHQVLEDFWEFSQQAQRLHNGHAGIDNGGNNMNNISDNPSSVAWKVGQPNLRSYNSVLEGYARQENAQEANRILARLQMVTSTAPNIASYTSAMKANVGHLEAVQTLARRCLEEYTKQKGKNVDDADESENHLTLDHAFFHAWLYSCARAKNVDAAKKVLRDLKQHLEPTSSTYLAFLEVFLAKGEPQAALEWLLAYAKLERMDEGTIVAWTCRLLRQTAGMRNHDVDSIILLQILCENSFITKDDAIEGLLLGISAQQGKAVLGWVKRPTLKMRVIVMRALAQDSSQALVVEELFQEWQHEQSQTSKHGTDQNEYKNKALVAEMYASLIVAWSKRGDLKRIQYWLGEFEKNPHVPPLNSVAQTAILQTYCKVIGPSKAEQYLKALEAAFQDGKIEAPPDTVMGNIVLNGWAQRGRGERAAMLLGNIREPDRISYNTVINAFSREGRMDDAEKYAKKLVGEYRNDPIESKRPDASTFTVILAGWRRSLHEKAAERSEDVLMWMHGLYEEGVLLSKPTSKSYRVVLDTWEKCNHPDDVARAQQLLASSEFWNDKDLKRKLRLIKSQRSRQNVPKIRMDES